MKRQALLDGLRGYFLVVMLVDHLWFDGGNPAALVNHNQLAFVEDAQGFILLSGLIVGLCYGRLCASGRGAEAAARLRARAGWGLHGLFGLRFLRFLGGHSLQVYAYHVILAYLIVLVDAAVRPLDPLGKATITGLAVASLAIPAWLHERLTRPAVGRPAYR